MIQIGASPATLDTPLEHLTACHRRIEQRLDTLTTAAAHLSTRREEALAAIAKSLAFLDSNGVMHTEDEEQSLFPRLRPKLTADELAFVETLERQHREADALYYELKTLVAQLDRVDAGSDVPAKYSQCATRLRSLYRTHIQAEDEILARMAKRRLEEPELKGISAEMRKRRGL